jgi:hypothetical protein
VSVAATFAVAITGIFGLADRYQTYQDDYRVVQSSDLAAFKWMSANLDTSDKILVDSRIRSSSLKTVVFAGDSGLWIPVYTDFQISADFLHAFSADVLQNALLYEQFSENPDDCRLRQRVREAGFNYYFEGSHAAHADHLTITPGAFHEIYSNGPVHIYQILTCDD